MKVNKHAKKPLRHGKYTRTDNHRKYRENYAKIFRKITKK